MAVRRSNVDMAMPNGLSIHGMYGGQRTGTAQDARQHALKIHGNVQDNEYCCLQVSGKSAHHFPEALHSPRGSAYYDNVASRQSTIFRPIRCRLGKTGCTGRKQSEESSQQSALSP